MKRMNPTVAKITESAAIAAVYIVLTVVFAPISFGPMQLRIAEILTILPMFTPSAVPGLFIGCIFANLFGGAVALDIVFGSIATLLGAAGGWFLRKKRWLVPLPAIAANTVIVPFVLRYGYGIDTPLLLLALYVCIGEILGCYVLGELFASVLLKRREIFRESGPQ